MNLSPFLINPFLWRNAKVKDLWLDRQEILNWADKYVEEAARKETTRRELALEKELEGLRVVVQGAGYLKDNQLRNLAAWKSKRIGEKTLMKNSAAFLREITSFALFSATDERALKMALKRGRRQLRIGGATRRGPPGRAQCGRKIQRSFHHGPKSVCLRTRVVA